MNSRTMKSKGPAALVGLLTLSAFQLAACTNGPGESVGENRSALISVGNPIGSGPGGGGVISNPGGGGGGYAPIPVYAPTVFAATATSSTVTLSWNEHGGNGTTVLYRQLYDLAGNPSGGLDAIATWTSLPAGPMTFTDRNSGVLKAPPFSPVSRITGINLSPIQPDHQIGYQVVEIASGYSDCEYVPGGQTCAGSSLIDAYTQSATPYGIGRAQLRIQVSDATSNASSLHVRAELSAWSATWLDSTQGDFQPGSDITYDLKTDYLDSRSDINFIDLWTPDSEGICVSDIALRVDNTTTFHESFATCRWVGNGGGEIMVPFTALRSSAEWQAYAPEVFPPSTLSAPVTFVGFDSAGLIAHLDAAVGDQLKNEIPSAANGFNAGLGAPTTITRTDATHLHVQQHLVNLDVVWDDIDFGTVSADPSYDLVIHNADAVCAGWCVDIENASGNSTYGWANAILDIVTLGVVPLINHEVNEHLQNALTTVSSLGSAGPFGFCFVPAVISHDNPGAVFATFLDDGVATPFDEGSLTICP
jgi:hypothetical protein